MQWQHPASALPPALLVPQATTTSSSAAAAAAAAADPAALLLHERAQHWREALRSAYISLRHGHCPVVYICGQVGAAVVVRGAGAGHRDLNAQLALHTSMLV